MQKMALLYLMLFLVAFGSNATAQMTVMIPAYEMTGVPNNPVTGPDDEAHQYWLTKGSSQQRQFRQSANRVPGFP